MHESIFESEPMSDPFGKLRTSRDALGELWFNYGIELIVSVVDL